MTHFLSSPEERPKQRTDISTRLAIFLMLGFSFLGKPFSYVALPLGAVMALDPRPLLRPFLAALLGRTPLSGLSWALFLSVLYGIWGVIFGILDGNNPVTVLEVFSFLLYPFYLYLGIWAGAQRPDFLRKYVRFFAWFGAICTPINFVLIHNPVMLPGFDEPTVISFGAGPGVLLGIFAFERNLARYWFPIATFSFWLIANQVRADWLGFIIALVIWGAATKQLGRVLGMAAGVIALLVVGFILDVRLPAVPGRGGELSARETIARAVAAYDPELAQNFSTEYSGFYSSTVGWRTNWWRAIREEVMQSPERVIFGLGYGYPIKNLVRGDMKKSDIRSPHNIFYFALAYSGAIGVFFFFWLQLSVLLLLWRTFRQTGQIYGMAFYVSTVVGAFFGNFLETPQEAIPTYILTGFCIGAMFKAAPAIGVQPAPQAVLIRDTPPVYPFELEAQLVTGPRRLSRLR